MNLTHLEAWDAQDGTLNVIIETPKGTRNKLCYNAEQELFELSKVLPRGLIFPFDFGFIPSTVGDDDDPVDVLVLMDEPVPAGCKIPARLIGVIEAKQTEDGKTERNDRLIAVANSSHEHRDIRSLNDLCKTLVEEIEHFFVWSDDLANKKYKTKAHHGPHRAEKLVRQAAKRYKKKHSRNNGQAWRNGRQKASRRQDLRPT
jgi:inorganic pyrophosphatase